MMRFVRMPATMLRVLDASGRMAGMSHYDP